jgi:hypothetical protein
MHPLYAWALVFFLIAIFLLMPVARDWVVRFKDFLDDVDDRTDC